MQGIGMLYQLKPFHHPASSPTMETKDGLIQPRNKLSGDAGFYMHMETIALHNLQIHSNPRNMLLVL